MDPSDDGCGEISTHLAIHLPINKLFYFDYSRPASCQPLLALSVLD
jgi:hypothetical protein